MFVFSQCKNVIVRKSLFSLFLFLGFLCSIQCPAQRFPFFNLKVENGLVQSQATCLSQDNFGNLWIGTLGGLSRYDGKKLSNFTVSDGLLSNTIIDIHFSTSNKLYISSAEGLQVFDGKRFFSIRDHKKQKATNVSQIAEGENKQIFFLKDGRLFTLDSARNIIRPLTTEEGITTMFFSKGTLKIATLKGALYSLSLSQSAKKIDSSFSTETNLLILKIFEDSKGRCWVLCNKGLYQKYGNEIRPYLLNGKNAVYAPLISATEDHNGQIWMASLSGVFRMNDTAISFFNQQSGLTNNTIYEALCDKEGNVWLSSDGEGVFRYSGGPFISLDENFGLPNKQVIGIAGDNKGIIYFASYQGKLSQYSIGSGIHSIDIPELRNDAITCIVWQEHSGLWIGTRNTGLFQLQNNKIKQYNLGDNGDPQITTLFKDDRNRLFVGLSKNILIVGPDNFKTVISIEDAKAVCLTSIGADSVLIATTKGLYLYENGLVSAWKKQGIMDSIDAQCMTMSGHTLYVGTTEKGIIAYSLTDKSHKILNTKNGLSSDFVYNIIKDKECNIWAGTGMGICKITQAANKKYDIKVFGKANGIIGMESNSNAAFADTSGHLWFGTTEGVSCYYPSAKPTLASPAEIVLESVKLFGGRSIDSNFYKGTSSWYSIPQQLELPYRLNNLSFSFQAITLSPVDKILYRYILEGSGINWSEWSQENTINFSALEPGTYTLRVKCMINGIEEKQVSLSYSFRIKTPFHKSIWFVISIIGLAILLGVYLQYAANKRKLKRQLREDALRKEEQSRVRERTAEDFHDEVGNKLTRINVLTSVLKSKLNTPNSDAERIIQQIQDNSQQLYAGTRDILWSLQPSNDNLFEILNHVRDLAAELFSETDISFSISGNDESFKDYKMPLDKSRNFIMIWKEALNNCMKYSGAKNVLFQIQRTSENTIQVRLVDDGKGFDALTVLQGNGLKNMQSRAKRLDATLAILSNENKGTQIVLNLPEGK